MDLGLRKFIKELGCMAAGTAVLSSMPWLNSCTPDKLKEVLVLKEFGEMNYKEIARALRISESNVKVRVFRAKEKLAEILNG